MYEVEIKVEINKEEKENLLKSLKDQGFIFKGLKKQNDYYIEAKESELGGQDLKRYRKEDEKFIYTYKTWEVVGNDKVRKEDEYEVSKEEFDLKLKEFPPLIKIEKDREHFMGTYKSTEISFTIDNVKFDHSQDIRYFIEAEVDTEERDKVLEIKNLIRKFLMEILGKPEIVEAPGMFSMAFNKK